MARRKKQEEGSQEPAAAQGPAQKSINDAVAEAVSAAIKESIPLAAGVMANVQKQGQPAKRAPVSSLEECGKCGQKLSACQDEHIKMMVLPQNRRHARFFQGIRINGKVYLSSYYGEKITVPAALESTIMVMIQQYEDNEEQTMNGRTAGHNSGVLGFREGRVQDSGFIPAHAAWR